jgi:hypothetical protein
MEHPLRELKMKKGHAGETESRCWEEDGVPKCNVVGIIWGKHNKSWQIQWRNANGKQQKAYEKEFGAAVKLLLSKPPDGKAGPGELAVHEGELVVTQCSMSACCRVMLPAIQFCPSPGRDKDRCYRYTKALEAILKSRPGGNIAAHIATICGLKQHTCFHCRGISQKSQRRGENNALAACYRAAAEIRADMALRGCAICRFKECLECDHEGRQDKKHKVLDPSYWTKYGHDGPEMMWREYRKQCIQVLCMNCHFMQPSHNSAKGADSTTLAKGSEAKRQREHREAKTRYNNGRKRAVGKCHYCKVPCVKGNERMFVWMHKDEIGKTVCVGAIVSLCINPDTANPIIDAIIDGGQVKSGKHKGKHQGSGCRLGCHNCHYKYETLPRRKIGVKLFDKLWGVPIVCTRERKRKAVDYVSSDDVDYVSD